MLKHYTGHVNSSYRIRSCLGHADSIVVSGSEDGTVHLWDILTGDRKQIIQAHDGKIVSAVAWNGSKKEWASAGIDGPISPPLLKIILT